MFIRRQHPLHTRLNDLIQLAIEGGLIGKWTADIEWNFRQKSNLAIAPKILTVEHIFLALLFLAIFTSCAIGAFIAELIIYNRVSRSNPHRFWKIADMLIDGKRQFLMPVWRKKSNRISSDGNTVGIELKPLAGSGHLINYKRKAMRKIRKNCAVHFD